MMCSNCQYPFLRWSELTGAPGIEKLLKDLKMTNRLAFICYPKA